MTEVDGFYSYAGTEVRWDERGVDVRRPESGRGSTTIHLDWHQIRGARGIGSATRFVQILLPDAAPSAVPSTDRLAFPVHSDADVQHLVTQLSWHAGTGYPTEYADLPGDLDGPFGGPSAT